MNTNPEHDFEGYIDEAVKEWRESLPESPTPEFWLAKSANRLKKFVEIDAPAFIIEREKRLLLSRVADLPTYYNGEINMFGEPDE